MFTGRATKECQLCVCVATFGECKINKLVEIARFCDGIGNTVFPRTTSSL